MISNVDVKRLDYFAYLARRYGTDVIKVVEGDDPTEWIVRVDEEFLLSKER